MKPDAAPDGPSLTRFRLWPRSLSGQLLLALAIALFVAQFINAVLLYRGQREQAEAQIASAAALRIISAEQRLSDGRSLGPGNGGDRMRRWRKNRRTQLLDHNPVNAKMRPLPEIAARIRPMLEAYDITPAKINAGLMQKPLGGANIIREQQGDVHLIPESRFFVVVALQRDDGQWLSVRVNGPPRGARVGMWLIAQTLVLFIVLFIPVVLLTRRISRPLNDLRSGVAAFQSYQTAQPIDVRGPSDVAELITAFNTMSHRIAAMLDEKDVMLGAIGHDLKTPLAALRVRVESVADDNARGRMVSSIDDINRTLDDILSLARIGRINSGPDASPEPVNLTALIEMVVEEFEDIGDDVRFADHPRITLAVHLTWIRRALRNLISNAVRYGKRARVTIARDERAVTIQIDDDGPGIPDDQIDRIFEPFTRLDGSRNTATGGAGLGLTLARAIADQHGGTLTLRNRLSDSGDVEGLTAILVLPVRTPKP